MEEKRNKLKRRIYLYLFWLMCGITLIVLTLTQTLRGEFFLPFSIAWCALAVSRIVRYTGIIKSDREIEEYFLFEYDERNLMIKHKSISIAAYSTIFIAIVATVCFEYVGNYDIAAALSGLVCAFVLIYVICSFIFRRKF